MAIEDEWIARGNRNAPQAEVAEAAVLRIADLEAFVRECENIDAAWVTGTMSSAEGMLTLSEMLRAIRAKMQPV